MFLLLFKSFFSTI